MLNLIIEAAVYTVVGWIVAAALTFIAAHLLKPWWKDLTNEIHTISDRLDTTTPGGLGDLVRRDTQG